MWSTNITKLNCVYIVVLSFFLSFFLAANTYCMMDDLSSRVLRAMGPRIQFSSTYEQKH